MVVETLKYAFADEIFPSITSFVFLKKFAGYTYEISYILLLLIISTGLYIQFSMGYYKQTSQDDRPE